MTDYAFDREVLISKERSLDKESLWEKENDTVLMLLIYLFDLKVYISPSANIDVQTDLLGMATLIKKMSGKSDTFTHLSDAELSKFIRHIIEYVGEFNPGDTLEIDMEKEIVRKNGVNAIGDIKGDFFELLEGLSEITYSDDDPHRNIRVTVNKNDRYL